MSGRLSQLSIEELVGVVLLVLAVIALAVNTGAIEKALVLRNSLGGSVGTPSLARDAEDQRMRLVLWLGRPQGGSSAPLVPPFIRR